MQSNPIVEKQQKEEQERRVREGFRYPFKIACVYEDKENSDFPIIREVKDYCDQNNLTFLARQYDTDKYGDDILIKRLPAFHIYYKNYIDGTEYYNSDPIRKIQILVWAYQDEMREKERRRIHRQEQWNTIVEGVKSVLSLEWLKKKAALVPEDSLSHARDDPNNSKTSSSS
jgi:hypothetical protein